MFNGFRSHIRHFFLKLINKAATISHLNQCHAQIIHNGLITDRIAITKLIQKFLDYKAVVQAKRLFGNTESPDLFLYNVLIKGCKDRPFDSLYVYKALLQGTALKPDNFTYSFVIAAVSGFPSPDGVKVGVLLHGHAVVSGFGSNVFVGSALVDMYMSLSRIGHAYKVFDGISGPDTGLWNTILSGLVKNCCFHDTLRVFHDMVVRTMLFDSTTLAVVLSGVAELQDMKAGMMVQALALKAASLRQLVKKKNLVKTPGCTLIELKGQQHVFTASDQSHPHSKAVYAMLDKLMGKMKDSGYLAETVTALHDVEEEEKELMVKVHSEKLAIAFGLIMFGEKDEIRIIKNLRVCLDCHNFTKFVSKITDRVIIMRDANRFHHFVNGACSCGDYW